MAVDQETGEKKEIRNLLLNAIGKLEELTIDELFTILRKRSGQAQNALFLRTHIPYQYISEFECGRRLLPPEEVSRLVKAMEKTPLFKNDHETA